MKKCILSLLLGLLVGIGILLYQPLKVGIITAKIQYSDILIKDNNMTILYKGSAVNIPTYLKIKHIDYISICEDDENTISIIVK